MPCAFTLQAALCAWKCLIWLFRGTPRPRFLDFSSFGTPRKPVFQNFEASGPPDGSFSQKTIRRGIPKPYFSEFLPFGMPRSVIFPIFRSSLISETLFLAIFDEKPRATGCFLVFRSSEGADGQFFLFFIYPRARLTVFFAFFYYPRPRTVSFSSFSFIRGLGRLFFSIFCQSEISDGPKTVRLMSDATENEEFAGD